MHGAVQAPQARRDDRRQQKLKPRPVEPWLAQAVERARTGAVFATALSRIADAGVEGVAAEASVPCDRIAWWLPDRSQSPATNPSTTSDDQRSDEPECLPAFFADPYKALVEEAERRLRLWTLDEGEDDEASPDILASIEIAGNPVGLVPKRTTTSFRPGNPRPFVVHYTDPRVRSWQKTIIAACRQQYRGETITGPVRLYAMFRVQRPKSHFIIKRDGTASIAKQFRSRYAPGKPDIDNLVKTLCDAIVRAGVIKDDSQIVTLWATKKYTPEPGGMPDPGVTVTIARHKA